MSNERSKTENFFRIVSMLGALGAFAWGVHTYRDTSQKQLDRESAEARRHAETRRIEAAKPFLDRQLALYTEASIVASKLATANTNAETEAARKRFWELYWGELALVESRDVEGAMVNLGRCLEREDCSRDHLKQGSLRLAHACRESLGVSWGVTQWRRNTP